MKATETNRYRAARQRRAFRKRLGRTVVYSAYVLSTTLIHLGLLIVVTISVPLGGGLTLIGGVVVILLGIVVARLEATAQRHLNEKAIGAERPELIYAVPESNGKVVRFLCPLRDPQPWPDVLQIFVSFPIAITSWYIVFIWVLMTSISLVQSLTLWATGVSNIDRDYRGIREALNIPYPCLFDAGFGLRVGSPFLVSGLYPMNATDSMQPYVTDVLSLRRTRDWADIKWSTRSREAGRWAENAALWRLERDLHDGPQQRLVQLNMDLVQARRQVGGDPIRTQAILGEAVIQTQDTLAELYRLSQGIAPPVLVGRGLVAAVQGAAARLVVPASIHAEIPTVPDHVASATYYVMAKSLVSMNKHAGASSVVVAADISGGVLCLSVVDGGIGGTDVSKGHGPMGLGERLRSVDDILEVDSPVGEPTIVEAKVPCVRFLYMPAKETHENE